MPAEEKKRMNVAVVVDPAYGKRLEDLSADVTVWVVATPINEDACRCIWRQRSTIEHGIPGSLTSYKIYSDAENRRANLLNIIPVIEEHYGSWKVAPPVPGDPDDKYRHLDDGFCLDVVGLDLTNDLKAPLNGFGFFSFVPTDVGFRAWIIRARGAA
jgi:hypothetical protein